MAERLLTERGIKSTRVEKSPMWRHGPALRFKIKRANNRIDPRRQRSRSNGLLGGSAAKRAGTHLI